MNTFKALTVPFLALAMACGADGPTGDPNQPGGETPGETEAELDVAGEYRVVSHFEMSTRDLADDIEAIALLEDIGNDPYKALADVIAEEAGVPFLSSAVQVILEDNLPLDVEAEVQLLANTVLDASGDFELISEMTIEGDSNLSIEHRAVGMEVEIDGKSYEWDFDSPADDPSAEGPASASRRGSDVSIESHSMTVPYSQMLVAVVDVVAVPAIDPSASNLGEALNTLVDCQAVGEALYDYELVPYVSADAYRLFCQVGVTELANQIYDRVDDIAVLEANLELRGDLTGEDVSGNGKADRIQGDWTGQFGIAENTAFTDAGSFDGERVR